MREAASPSFFNPAEAVVVLEYIKQLVAEGVKPRDIGVITPYRLEAATLFIFDSPQALIFPEFILTCGVPFNQTGDKL